MQSEGRLRLSDVFVSISDQRQSKKTRHDLVELLVMAMNGVLANSQKREIIYLTARYIVIPIIKMTLEIVVQAKAWNTPCLAFHSVIAERWWARRFAPLLTLRAFNYGNYSDFHH
ncbi:MAG: hypothetical protein LBI31_02210 [Zoogloeaceae bacterium]|jgi:hypothetical protein|nr:hypothetical protein [Zoogloeaceae bacterium]